MRQKLIHNCYFFNFTVKPEEAIASLNESEADRLGRLAVMFYKETGDGVYKEKAEQIRAAQGELPEDICAMPFFMEYETVCGKKERYNKIVDRMEDEASAGFADAKARNAYLAALVDVIDGISFEIYEKYRTLTAVYLFFHLISQSVLSHQQKSDCSCRTGGFRSRYENIPCE